MGFSRLTLFTLIFTLALFGRAEAQAPATGTPPAAAPAPAAAAVTYPSYAEVKAIEGRVQAAEANLCLPGAKSEKPACDQQTKPQTGVASILAVATETRAQADIQRELAFFNAFSKLSPAPVLTPESLKKVIESTETRITDYKKTIETNNTRFDALSALQPVFAGASLPSPVPQVAEAGLAELRKILTTSRNEIASSIEESRSEITRLKARMLKAKPSQRKDYLDTINEYESEMKRYTPLKLKADQNLACAVAMTAASCPPAVLARVKSSIDETAAEAKATRTMYEAELKSVQTQLESLKQQLVMAEQLAASKANNPVDTDAERLAEFETNYLTQSRATSRNSGWQTCGLSVGELEAILYYAGSGYSPINNALRKGGADLAQMQPIIDELNAALAKLPKFDGYVVRGGELPAPVRAEHTVGNIVTYAAFTSTSLNSGFDSTDRFVIHSRSGRYIGSYSPSYRESEVLIPSNTRFKVLAIKKEGNITTYTLDEVVP